MKVALVCSHGGHFTETVQILDAFADHDIFFATYHSSREEDVRAIAPAYFTDNIGASYRRMFLAFFWALDVLRREKPDVVVSLGSEIAIPFFVWAKLLGIRTLFIESWCRVENLSKTGRLLYPIADEFWVQWPQLQSVGGSKARYKGSVV